MHNARRRDSSTQSTGVRPDHVGKWVAQGQDLSIFSAVRMEVHSTMYYVGHCRIKGVYKYVLYVGQTRFPPVPSLAILGSPSRSSPRILGFMPEGRVAVLDYDGARAGALEGLRGHPHTIVQDPVQMDMRRVHAHAGLLSGRGYPYTVLAGGRGGSRVAGTKAARLGLDSWAVTISMDFAGKLMQSFYWSKARFRIQGCVLVGSPSRIQYSPFALAHEGLGLSGVDGPAPIFCTVVFSLRRKGGLG